MKSGHRLRCGAAALALAVASGLVATPAYAQGTATQQLLKRLHEKGILTDEEYNQIMAETNATPPPAPVAAAAPAVMTDASGEPVDTNKFVKMMESGIGFQVGPANIKFSGSVNAFYVHDNPQNPGANTAVTGGLAQVANTNSSSVRNGLLPGFLLIDVTTQQAGLDIGAHFGMYPGINSANWGPLGANNGGQPTALA
ncbi:MAG: SHOCT domain-containing protein, partial [Porphyrobacter sp.]|nr:SHOCT domain-containing protein [Porphyrobacter sp.]